MAEVCIRERMRPRTLFISAVCLVTFLFIIVSGSWAVLPICGDLNGSGAVDTEDIIYSIDYIYRAGPAPAHSETGDVNCNYKINILDITYLINYLFRNGFRPCINCRSMAVYGDSRTNHTVHQQIADMITSTYPSIVFHTGDLVENGNYQGQWDIFNSITSGMRTVAEFYPSLGNHENQSPLYFQNFELPNNEQWYSVERNNIHFVVLNSCIPIDTVSEQYLWLKNDLAGINDSIKYTVAVFHYPPYSAGQHTEDEKGLRQTLIPLFEEYGIDIVFTGHDHDYERSFCGGIYYIVTGGGGAPLRGQARTHPCSQLFLMKYNFCILKLLKDRLVVKVFDNNSQMIDQFEVIGR